MPRVISVSDSQSLISTDKTTPAADGVEVNTISLTVKQVREEGGEALPVAGLPAAQVVVAVNGTGNTVTQPTGVTGQDGVITASYVSTVAQSKTVSATVCGLALVNSATVSQGGSTSPAGLFFSDDFSTGSRTSAGGFTWSSTGGRVTVSTTNPRAGQTHSLHFRFGPDADGADSSAEQPFNMGRDVPHLWLEYYLYVPAGYVHRNSTGPDNNKFLALWRDTYSDVGGGTWRFFQELERGTGDVSTCRTMASRWDLNSATDTGLGFASNGSTVIGPSGPITTGEWTQVRFEIATASNATATDGIIRIWFDGVLFGEMTNGKFWNFDTGSGSGVDCVLKQGYFLGWSNSGFLAETILQISEVKFYNEDPSW